MRKFLVTMAVAIATLAAQPAALAQKIQLLHTGVATYASAFVAKDQGFFEKRGLDVSISRAANGSVLLSALVADSAQMVLPTPTIYLQGLEAGMDILAVGSTNVFPGDVKSGLVAGPDSGISSAKDLEGKRVGVPGLGGLLDVMLRKWVSDQGVDTSKVRFVEAVFTSMADMISAKQIDAAAAVDPFLSRIMGQAKGKFIDDFTKAVPAGATATVYVTTNAWAKKHPNAVPAFQAALVEAKAFIDDKTNEAKVKDSIAKYTGLPAPVIQAQPVPTVLVEVTVAQLTPWVDIALAQGVIRKKVDLKGHVAPWQPK